MNDHFTDRLVAAIRTRKNALCVGLDPRWQQLPLEVRRRHDDGTLASLAGGVEEFCLRLLEVVAPLVAVVKPQSAFFEMCGPAGLVALQRVLAKARRLGLVTILDSKRNDIAATAEAYAEAALGRVELGGRGHPVWDADAVTINPYLGRDAVEPFLVCARRRQRGVFVLVRTSNPGAGQFQDLVCAGQPLYRHVAEAVGVWARAHVGSAGFGDVGAVVGATHPNELAAVRQLLPDVWLLLPGFGAQGGTASDAAAGFRPDGLGAIVNSSRGISGCFRPEEPHWEEAVADATRSAIAALARDTPMGQLNA